MADPTVSVILPVYNVERFVRASISSVLSQSYSNFELIVVDDGSTDSTAAEVQALQDGRIVVLRQPNSGVAAARNTAVGHARGRYFAFMDGDDVWMDGKLERDVAYLDAHPEADLVFSFMCMVDEDGRDLGRPARGWAGIFPVRDLLIEDLIGSPTVLMRREAMEQAGAFDESLPAASDYDYWLRVGLLRSSNLHGEPRLSLLYRRREGQMTRNWKQQEEAWHRIMAKMRRMCPAEVADVANRSLANQYRSLAAGAYEMHDVQSARRLFRKALAGAGWFLLKDKRTWTFGAALFSASVLPSRIHEKIEKRARQAATSARIRASQT